MAGRQVWLYDPDAHDEAWVFAKERARDVVVAGFWPNAAGCGVPFPFEVSAVRFPRSFLARPPIDDWDSAYPDWARLGPRDRALAWWEDNNWAEGRGKPAIVQPLVPSGGMRFWGRIDWARDRAGASYMQRYEARWYRDCNVQPPTWVKRRNPHLAQRYLP